MHYLQVKNLHKSYGLKPLLNGVDFAITKGQKVALVAKNGAGKSTLFRLLQGLEQVDDGDILFNKSIEITFLAQQSENASSELVSEYLKSITQEDREHEVKINKMINILNLKPLLEKPLNILSGGERKRVELAKALMHEPQFLLLDEPTNHLDIDMINRLENYLKRSHITVFMITHDRYFLERVCTDIRELNKGKLHQYEGNYQKYLYKKSEREEMEITQLHKLKQLYTAELAWMKRAPSGRQTKKVNRIEDFKEIKTDFYDKKDIQFKQSKKIELSVEERRLGGKIIKINKLNKAFGDQIIIKDFTYNLQQGERIGILGDNGMGKSTLVNIIAGTEPYDSGDVQFGPTVTLGYYRQSEDIEDTNLTIIEYIKQFAEAMIVWNKRISASLLLENFLFDPRQQQSKVFGLSGGERKRLQLCITLIKNPNVLVLDEPTNDLDIETMTILEDFLMKYAGCLLIISHDRYFLDKLVEHVLVFEWEGKIWDYRGNYSDYKNNKTEIVKSKKKNNQKDEEVDIQEEIKKEKIIPKKLSYHEQREFEQLGNEIATLDMRKDEINAAFQEDLDSDKIVLLSKELSELVKLGEQKEKRWFELAERE